VGLGEVGERWAFKIKSFELEKQNQTQSRDNFLISLKDLDVSFENDQKVFYFMRNYSIALAFRKQVQHAKLEDHEYAYELKGSLPPLKLVLTK
jgi:hypothetical protein